MEEDQTSTTNQISNSTIMKKFFRNLAIGVAAATMTFAAVPAKADNFEKHQQLWNTLETVGVDVVVNHQEACKDNWGGAMYMTFKDKTTAIVICQDKGKGVEFDEQVQWTANDFDSLRHEAQHVVQDCAHGIIGDNIIKPYMDDDTVVEFAQHYLSSDMVKMILTNYDEEDHWIELEAFAVAAGVSPIDIANALTKACR